MKLRPLQVEAEHAEFPFAPTRDEIFQYTNEYTESPEYTKSIRMSIRSLLSIPKSHPRVTQKDTAVNQIS